VECRFQWKALFGAAARMNTDKFKITDRSAAKQSQQFLDMLQRVSRQFGQEIRVLGDGELGHVREYGAAQLFGYCGAMSFDAPDGYGNRRTALEAPEGLAQRLRVVVSHTRIVEAAQ
jgi:hypothetical protein